MLRSILTVLALIPLFASAQIVFENTLVQPGDETGEAIVQLDDGSAIIGSNVYSPNWSSCNTSLVKIDKNGKREWTKTTDLPGAQYLEDLVLTNDKHLLIFGTAPTPGTESRATTDFLLVKTNLQGHELWRKQYGTPGDEDGSKIVALNDGYLLTGSIISKRDVEDFYLVKIDHAGNVIWEKTIEAKGRSFALDCIVDDNQNIVMSGFISPFHSGAGKMIVMQLDSKGELRWMWEAPQGTSESHGRRIWNDGSTGYWVHAFWEDQYRMIHFTQAGVDDRMEAAGEEVFQLESELGFVQLSSSEDGTQMNAEFYDEEWNYVKETMVQHFTPWAAAMDADGNITMSGDMLNDDNDDDIHIVKLNAFAPAIEQGYNWEEDYLHAYPNPSLDGKFYFEYELVTLKSFMLEMYDLTGRVVYSKRVRGSEGKITIELKNALPGTYIIKAWKGKEELYTERVVLLD